MPPPALHTLGTQTHPHLKLGRVSFMRGTLREGTVGSRSAHSVGLCRASGPGWPRRPAWSSSDTTRQGAAGAALSARVWPHPRAWVAAISPPGVPPCHQALWPAAWKRAAWEGSPTACCPCCNAAGLFTSTRPAQAQEVGPSQTRPASATSSSKAPAGLEV